MKRNLLLLFTLLCLSACNQDVTEPLELRLSTPIIRVHKDFSGTGNLAIVQYNITNRSHDIYYFNNMIESKNIRIKGVYKQGKGVRIYDGLGDEIPYEDIYQRSMPKGTQLEAMKKESWQIKQNWRRLGYEEVPRLELSKGGYTNFFIHPNETLFFEYFIELSDTINDSFRRGYVQLEPRKKYWATLSIASDTTAYKRNLTRDILRTIKVNHAKIYYGTLTSGKVALEVEE